MPGSKSPARSIRVGIDIGGTFTDLQILDEASGSAWALKTPTTPDDPSIGLMTGLAEAAHRFGFALDDIAYLLHGTTIATNAVLERKLPRGVLVTTAGFEDVLEIGRHARRDVYALSPKPTAPLIPRDHRIGVAERVAANGRIETPLGAVEIARLIDRIGTLAPEAVAIVLLNAYVEPRHESALRAAIAAAYPTLPTALSSEISPEIREYERSSTTVLNALLMPVVRAYLERLESRLKAANLAPRLLLVQSNGGVCDAALAAAQPVRLLLSGPSGGALAALRLAETLQRPRLVGIDMGGTSFDVSVVQDGRVSLITQGEVDQLPVRLPMIEIRTIGAGGGSIAAVDAGGRLTVGPRSAGARPGPVCYGHGGASPTVTDANLVLGRLDAAYFLGGAMALDHEGARNAIASQIGGPLELSPEAAAEGVLTVTNTSLAAAIRLSLFEKGLDPREFALLSFGGAGGLHAIPVADALGITEVVFPREAATLSAYGILHSDIVHDFAQSRILPATSDHLDELREICEALRRQGEAQLAKDGQQPEQRSLSLSADMRYHGQAFELMVPWGDVAVDAAALATFTERFHALHEQRFSYANRGDPVEIVTVRLTATGRLASGQASPTTARGDAATGRRPIFIGGAWREATVCRWDQLATTLAGPALIEEPYTTIFLAEGWTAALAPSGDLVARRTMIERPASADRATAHPDTGHTLGPIELEVLRNALTAAAAEMDVTIWRTSRSTIVRELLDYSTAIFDRDGFNVAQSARIPQHLNSMGAGLREILQRFLPPETWQPGDVVITNDPYCGGQHLPDILAFRPVFHAGERIAIVGTLCHHLDVGGISAGSYGATATEIFQEGLRIPPLKLYEGGTLQQGILAILRQNVRKPAILWGDLQSQIASLAIGEANLRALAEKYGNATLLAACDQILDASERATRAMIGRMPDGRYEFADILDDDGISDAPIPIHAAIEITGEEMVVDLSGSGSQVAGPINATLASSGSAVSFAVMACADEAIPANAGCYRPVRIIAPEGLIVSARHPAPVANRVAVTHRLINVLLGALHQAVPDRIPAAYYGVSYVCTLQTVAEDGERRVLVEIEIGGAGGHPTEDGANAMSCGMHNNANIPIEMIESDAPLTIQRYGLRPDSAGAGQHRGGLGLVREWRIDAAEAIFTANLERFRSRPYGLAGGGEAAPGRLTLIRDGVETALRSKVGNLALKRGDVIRLETSGGGGFGDPTLRDRGAAERDRRLGYTAR